MESNLHAFATNFHVDFLWLTGNIRNSDFFEWEKRVTHFYSDWEHFVQRQTCCEIIFFWKGIFMFAVRGSISKHFSLRRFVILSLNKVKTGQYSERILFCLISSSRQDARLCQKIRTTVKDWPVLINIWIVWFSHFTHELGDTNTQKSSKQIRWGRITTSI